LNQPTLTVANDAPGQRFVLQADGAVVGLAEYQTRPGVIAFTHTEVAPEFGGRGLGSHLVRTALDQAREENLEVLPYCVFVRDFIAFHPEYLGLVPESRRSSFGLPTKDVP
jgi:predicted GNAT family acetyltransferase